MRAKAPLVLVATAAVALAGFGTVNVGRQSAEHEKITRLALGCAAAGAADDCFEPEVVDQLAGRRGTFGAIGYPDASYAVFQSKAHCDNGDALPTPGYPRTAAQARAELEACRAWMEKNLAAAVKDADALVDKEGRIRRSEVTLFVPCIWAFNVKGRAKCNVLQDMGIALHAAQDFYAHSNWTDRGGGASPADPPGLGAVGAAPWISLRDPAAPFPEGMITGCFTVAGSGCEGRVTHATLNKDTGRIAPGGVGPGTTPRGAAGENFRFAVEAAVADTADKWALLRERLAQAYGPRRAGQMVCALTRDDPMDDCQPAL
jgi:hypothetical protein